MSAATLLNHTVWTA